MSNLLFGCQLISCRAGAQQGKSLFKQVGSYERYKLNASIAWPEGGPGCEFQEATEEKVGNPAINRAGTSVDQCLLLPCAQHQPPCSPLRHVLQPCL